MEMVKDGGGRDVDLEFKKKCQRCISLGHVTKWSVHSVHSS